MAGHGRPVCIGWIRRAESSATTPKDSTDPSSLSSSLVRSTYEDREGTLWVCTIVGLDAFDRRTKR